jgi:hypothetical protein
MDIVVVFVVAFFAFDFVPAEDFAGFGLDTGAFFAFFSAVMAGEEVAVFVLFLEGFDFSS